MTDRPRRLDPIARRHQLLDVACDIVERDGVAACTDDAVSTEAGVTPQLVRPSRNRDHDIEAAVRFLLAGIREPAGPVTAAPNHAGDADHRPGGTTR